MNRGSLRVLALTIMMIATLAPLRADAAAGPPTGANVDLSNVRLPDAAANLGQAPQVNAFGAACDGTTDDAAAFATATVWLAVHPNRVVQLPAGRVCATSATVTLGDGRQQSTTLTGAASGSSLAVASCTGVVTGDTVGVKRDDGTLFTTTTTGCVGTTLSLNAAYSGGTASSGNVVFTGRVSSYNGGGFRGYGAGMAANEFPGGATVTTIKYIGAAAPTTTLGAQANATDRTLTVAGIANIALGTALGIDLNDGSRFWTWADQTPTGTSVHLGNEIPSTANSGNGVTIASNPVFKINGPMAVPVLEGVQLDANSLAAIGLEAMHPVRGKFQGPQGVKATGYTAIGHYIHSGEFYAGAATGIGDNDFQLYTAVPQNNQTVGCWFRGTGGQSIAFSRNRFHGGSCTMGGHDARAAGMLVEFIDNNMFIKPYTAVNGASTAGCGLYRQPSAGKLLFPNENTYLGAAFIGKVCDGTATGGTLGVETMPSYSVYDGEVTPNSATLSGTTSAGLPFGLSTPRDHSGGLALSKLSATQVSIDPGMVADSTGNTMLARTTTCTASLNNSGNQGIDTGSKAASTWYAVFLIGNGSNGLASCLFSATTAAAVPTPTLPSPFTFYAYVGRFKTDGSSNVSAVSLLPRGQFYIDASDTYTPGASGFQPRSIRLLACGGGGGGGSGGRQVSGTAISGGAGGSGGGCGDVTYPLSRLSATVAVTVGAGGAAVSPPGTDNTAGVAGNAGNPTYFGASTTAAYSYGGAGCAGDGGRLNAAAASGDSGAGAVNVVGTYPVCSNGAAGTGGTGMNGAVDGVATGTTPAATSASSIGNTGGSVSTTVAATGGTASGRLGCPGGGGGGPVTSAPASVGGGAGGRAADSGVSRGTAGSSGTHDGGAGAASAIAAHLPGTGAGGGYGNSAGAAGNGGAGAQCAGGGGGGSALNGSVAGSGGAGGSGYAFVWEMR